MDKIGRAALPSQPCAKKIVLSGGSIKTSGTSKKEGPPFMTSLDVNKGEPQMELEWYFVP